MLLLKKQRICRTNHNDGYCEIFHKIENVEQIIKYSFSFVSDIINWKFNRHYICIKRMLSSLHRQHVTHSPGGFFLGAGADVGVGVQSEAGGEVARHAGDGLNVHAVLQRQRSEGMAQVMEADAWQSRPLQYSVQHVVHAVRRDGAAGG